MFAIAAVVGLAVWVAGPAWLAFTPRFVSSYDAFALTLLALLWFIGVAGNVKKTSARAAANDPGRNFDFIAVLTCIAVGLISAVNILGRGSQGNTPQEKAFIYGLGLTAIVVGWFIIHTLFLFRYAHLYYFNDDDDQDADRGLTFPGTDQPTDADFAYFSFVIGMTFQVSDVSITDSGVRREALIHALISFAYNTLIVALCINILSGLFH